MDISYMLYYLMMDDLRSRLKKKFPGRLFGPENYLYTNLTNIHDVERLEGTLFPNDLVGEIEISFADRSFLLGSLIRVERCQIYSSAAFALEHKNNDIRDVIEQWMMAVKIRYFMKN
jgi:hypothetical protein